MATSTTLLNNLRIALERVNMGRADVEKRWRQKQEVDRLAKMTADQMLSDDMTKWQRMIQEEQEIRLQQMEERRHDLKHFEYSSPAQYSDSQYSGSRGGYFAPKPSEGRWEGQPDVQFAHADNPDGYDIYVRQRNGSYERYVRETEAVRDVPVPLFLPGN